MLTLLNAISVFKETEENFVHVPQTKLLHSGLRQEAVIYSVAGKKKKKKANGEDLLMPLNILYDLFKGNAMSNSAYKKCLPCQ